MIKTISDYPLVAGEILKRNQTRQSRWIRWMRKHGAGDKSISRFLELHPPSSPTEEAADLKSVKCEFDSHDREK